MEDLIARLTDKDDRTACAYAGEIGARSAESDRYYCRFEEFAGLMGAKSSYVRTRGFVLCCAQAGWDDRGKLAGALNDMLKLLHDEKPTAVRQCLKALREVVLYRPELCETIVRELNRIDPAKYKDSMAPLIGKDISDLMNVIRTERPAQDRSSDPDTAGTPGTEYRQ